MIDTFHHTYIISLWLTTGASRGGGPQRPILNKMLLDSLTANFSILKRLKTLASFTSLHTFKQNNSAWLFCGFTVAFQLVLSCVFLIFLKKCVHALTISHNRNWSVVLQSKCKQEVKRSDKFATPTKNQRTKKNNTSEHTMLLDVLKTKTRFKKDKNRTCLSNHSLIVSWFHHSIPAHSPSLAISQRSIAFHVMVLSFMSIMSCKLDSAK